MTLPTSGATRKSRLIKASELESLRRRDVVRYCAQCKEPIDLQDATAVIYMLLLDNAEPLVEEAICGPCWERRDDTWRILTASNAYLGPYRLYR